MARSPFQPSSCSISANMTFRSTPSLVLLTSTCPCVLIPSPGMLPQMRSFTGDLVDIAAPFVVRFPVMLRPG